MLQASVLDLTYCRALADDADADFTRPLKERFDYAFVVSYGAFTDTDFEVVARSSCVLNLTQGLDSILQKCSPTCRNEIRRTSRMPELSFHVAGGKNSAAYSLHRESEMERGWLPVPPDEFENSLVVHADWCGEPIAGMTCYFSESRLRVGRIFSRRQASRWAAVQKVVFSASARRIVHELCRIGIEHGCKTLDLGGIDLSDPAKTGISQFKMSFGGEIVPVKLGRFEKPRFAERKSEIRALGYDIT